MATELGMLKAVFLSTILDHAAAKWAVGLGIVMVQFLFPNETLMRCGAGVLGLIALNWLTAILGLIVRRRKLSRVKARKGIIKIAGYAVWILLVALATASIPELKGAHPYALGILLGHIGWTEFVSVIENLNRMGTPFPEAVIDGLKTYRAKKETREKELGATPEKETEL